MTIDQDYDAYVRAGGQASRTAFEIIYKMGLRAGRKGMNGAAAQESTLDQWVERLPESHRARKELAELREDLESTNFTFELQWEADRRAIRAWQQAHPDRKDVWPDRANMVTWLMERLDAIGTAPPAQMSYNGRLVNIDATGMREVIDEAVALRAAFEHAKVRDHPFTECCGGCNPTLLRREKSTTP